AARAEEACERVEARGEHVEVRRERAAPPVVVRGRAYDAAVGGAVEPRFVRVGRLRRERRIDVDEVDGSREPVRADRFRDVERVAEEEPPARLSYVPGRALLQRCAPATHTRTHAVPRLPPPA